MIPPPSSEWMPSSNKQLLVVRYILSNHASPEFGFLRLGRQRWPRWPWDTLGCQRFSGGFSGEINIINISKYIYNIHKCVYWFRERLFGERQLLINLDKVVLNATNWRTSKALSGWFGWPNRWMNVCHWKSARPEDLQLAIREVPRRGAASLSWERQASIMTCFKKASRNVCIIIEYYLGKL